MHFELWLLLFASILLVYTWLGYPCLLFLSLAIRGRRGSNRDRRKATHPTVSIIIAAHNEEAVLRAKLENCWSLDYPAEQIEIIVASDGSTDQTEAIVEQFAGNDPRIRLLRSAGRAGKSGVQNLAAENAQGEVLFFTDANTRLNADCLQLLVDGLADRRVGLVSTEVFFGSPDDAVSQGQGFYWRFEFSLRQLESDLGILATASGCAFAMRRELFCPLPSCYGDDCIVPIDVRLQGYLVLHEQRAIAFDAIPHSIGGELRTRIRMTARNWSGTLARPGILNPFRFPGTALALFSHKLLRWLTPFLLATIFICNTALLLHGRALLLWVLQIGFYLSAFVGWLRTRRERPAGVFGYPFSFCLANVGFFLGLVKVVRNQRIVTYQATD